MMTYTKAQRARKGRVEPVKNSDRVRRRRLDVYWGARHDGTIIVNDRSGLALAWSAKRRFLGHYWSISAASRAISKADQAGMRTDEARRRLAEPVGFASGLPAAWGPRR